MSWWRTLRPPYAPGGFCVAKSMKCGCGLICSHAAPDVPRERKMLQSRGCTMPKAACAEAAARATALAAARADGSKTHRLLQLRDEQLSVVIQQAVERLKHVARRKVELVKHDPVAKPHSRNESALHERDAAASVRDIGADVLGDVSVLMIVQAHKPAPQVSSQESRHGEAPSVRGATAQASACYVQRAQRHAEREPRTRTRGVRKTEAKSSSQSAECVTDAPQPGGERTCAQFDAPGTPPETSCRCSWGPAKAAGVRSCSRRSRGGANVSGSPQLLKFYG